MRRATFSNPVLPGCHPDPSICRVGADFYLAVSSFEYFPGVPLFHSRDLVHWRPIGHALTRRSQLDLRAVPSSDGIYAPTLRHARGRFTMVTTNIRRGGNFFVTAPRAEGPWSDPVWIDDDGIDPSLFFDDDGAVYYTRNGRGADRDHPIIYQARIDPRTGKLLDRLRPVWRGTGGIWPEAPHLYKIGTTYYLMCAEGGTHLGHSEVIARSAEPFGPFEAFPGNPIVTHRDRPRHPIQALGHADLVELDDGTWWAVMLGIRPRSGGRHHLGRETFLAPVRWTTDGWPIVGEGGRVELEMPAPRLAAPPPPEPDARDDFDSPRLAPTWSFVRNPAPRDTSLSARRGFLRLVGSPVTLDDVASPAAVLRRQAHFHVTMRASLDFTPARANEEAGVTLRGNEAFRYDLAVRLGAMGREVVLRRRLAGRSRIVARQALAPGPVELRIDATAASYTFAAGPPGKARALGSLPTRSLSAESITAAGKGHCFTGVFVGPYATGGGRRSSVPADFDWFEYRPAKGR